MAKRNGHGPADRPDRARRSSQEKEDKAGKGETHEAPHLAPHAWHELGDFFVSFGYVRRGGQRHYQTRAYFSQDDLFMAWEGIAGQDVLDWIFEQAQECIPAAAFEGRLPGRGAKALPGAPIALSDTKGESSRDETQEQVPESPVLQLLRAHELASGEHTSVSPEVQTSEQSSSSLENRPMDLEILDLSLSEVPVLATWEYSHLDTPKLRAAGRLRSFQHGSGEAAFRVEMVLFDADSAEASAHAEIPVAVLMGAFDEGELSCPLEVEFPTPPSGRYCLKTVAKLTATNGATIEAEVQGPRLRIE